MRSVYLIGSLRNPALPLVATELRKVVKVFDDWYAAGPTADDAWQAYEQRRGHSYSEALQGLAAHHVFAFDHYHLKRCDAAVLVLPAGKSAHLELGWMLGQGKPGWILVDTPERWDVMYKFATGIAASMDELVETVAKWAHPLITMRPGQKYVLPKGMDPAKWVPPTMIDLDRLRARVAQSKEEPVYCFTCGMLIGPGSPPERHARCRT